MSSCQVTRRTAAAPNGLQAALEVGERALHRALDRTPEKPAAGSSAQARPRLELDREAVLESIADGREAPLMARVRQPLLDAGVPDETDRARVVMRLHDR